MHNDLSTQPSLWQAVEAPVGHFSVLRALPTAAVQSVGPFVFLDHFGPFPATPETLPAHPHAGIEVMTYLLEGANEHRDSLGHQGVIHAGGAQWMRAGRGILHAETNLPALAPTIHGLQIWARLPPEHQFDEPAYRAIAATDVVQWQEGGAGLRLLAGNWSGRQGPIPLTAESLLLHVQLAPGATFEWDADALAGFELGLYGVTAQAQVGETALARGQFLHLGKAAGRWVLNNPGTVVADVLLLGGAPVRGPLVFGGPFVVDSRAALQQVQKRYFAGEMGTLDGVPF